MSHSHVAVYLHIVFATKNRTPWLGSTIEEDLFPYLATIARGMRVDTLCINGVEDHVHLLQKLHPQATIAKLVGDMKSHSTAFLKRKGLKDFAWQQGYGAFSCSVNQVGRVKTYIQNQKQHHQHQTFDQEMTHFGNQWGFHWQA